MCLIITSHTGEMPNNTVLTHAFEHNPHGWGITYFDGHSVHVEKGMRLKPFLAACARIEGMPYMLHLRYATHGAKNRANTHPFKLSNGAWLTHNGIIRIECPDKRRSDTYHFAQLLSRLIEDDATWFTSATFADDVADYIGQSNKLAFMDQDGHISHVNKEHGFSYSDMWFSNEYSLPFWYGLEDEDADEDEAMEDDLWIGWNSEELRELETRYQFRSLER